MSEIYIDCKKVKEQDLSETRKAGLNILSFQPSVCVIEHALFWNVASLWTLNLKGFLELESATPVL